MINRIVLVGRLTKDPELRYTPNGVAVARFTLAVDRNYTNQQGERETDFIRIVTWRQVAEACANYLKKGRLTGIDGRLQIRSFDTEQGQRVTIAEVIAETVRFLESKGGEQKESAANTDELSGDPFDDPFDDDDLPF